MIKNLFVATASFSGLHAGSWEEYNSTDTTLIFARDYDDACDYAREMYKKADEWEVTEVHTTPYMKSITDISRIDVKK
jgi:hypothetical protein